MTYRIMQGDVIEQLRLLPSESVHCCVTSPPYWGLRDYGVEGQLGLEKTPQEYLAKMTEVFREVRRVLRPDGTLWVNMGDSYNANQGSGFDTNRDGGVRKAIAASPAMQSGLQPKQLMGMPWRLAFALQADGWWLRQDIIWAKPNPMPESATDRCTKAHEYIFLLTKNARYYYDADAIRTPLAPKTFTTFGTKHQAQGNDDGGFVKSDNWGKSLETRSPRLNHDQQIAGANKRSVWTVAIEGYAEAHFATFPTELIKPCILAGCPEGGVVLDPFTGSGTTAVVALRHNRNFIGIELNPKYVQLAHKRIIGDRPMFNVEVNA